MFSTTTHAQKPPPMAPVARPVGYGWLGIDWQAAEALGTWIGFIVLLIGLGLAYYQLRAIKDAMRADLIVRLDERYCSNYFQNLRQKAEKLKDKPDALARDEREDLINFLGFFELLGLYERSGFITLDHVDTMFGSLVLKYRNEFSKFIDQESWWKHFKDLSTKIANARGSRSNPV